MAEVDVVWHCNCGFGHPSFDDWAKCPMALVPRPNEAWWRNPKLGDDKMRTANAAQQADCPYCGAIHKAICPRIKRVEYLTPGVFRVVEFFSPAELAAKPASAQSIFEQVFGKR